MTKKKSETEVIETVEVLQEDVSVGVTEEVEGSPQRGGSEPSPEGEGFPQKGKSETSDQEEVEGVPQWEALSPEERRAKVERLVQYQRELMSDPDPRNRDFIGCILVHPEVYVDFSGIWDEVSFDSLSDLNVDGAKLKERIQVDVDINVPNVGYDGEHMIPGVVVLTSLEMDARRIQNWAGQFLIPAMKQIGGGFVFNPTLDDLKVASMIHSVVQVVAVSVAQQLFAETVKFMEQKFAEIEAKLSLSKKPIVSLDDIRASAAETRFNPGK